MKNHLSLWMSCTALLLTISCAYPIIGDTEAEAFERYGTPVQTLLSTNKNWQHRFEKEGTIILAEAQQGKIVCLIYGKTTTSEKTSGLTAQEVEAILYLQGGHNWKRMEDNESITFQHREKAVTAVLHKQSHWLLLATQEFHRKWKAQQEEKTGPSDTEKTERPEPGSRPLSSRPTEPDTGS